MNARQLVAWNVRKLRVGLELSQEKLAADAQVDRAYLGGLEREIENPTIDLLDRVAAALGQPIGALFAVPAAGEEPPASLPPGRKRPGDR
ncbi:helix-turn-helix transcriptional regulator [Devosia sp.]|uniref:helix-turn-helix transcriptional regulator n=1 Tax=Devosia sp. TaxID=1871048 RepID=UPI003F728C41